MSSGRHSIARSPVGSIRTQLLLDFSPREFGRSREELLPTFADCRGAAIHRWHPMVVGFSRSYITDVMREHDIESGMLVLDPFLGSGTTCVVAKALGISSVGIEAHPLLALVSRVKTRWDVYQGMNGKAQEIADRIIAAAKYRAKTIDISSLPPFVRKLFPDEAELAGLYGLKDSIYEQLEGKPRLREFFTVALMRAAHDATPAKIDGVYIAPETLKKTVIPAFAAFSTRVTEMLADLEMVLRCCNNAPARVIEGDARCMSEISTASVDLVVTSPPYLNNFDYAEMTRLELYLLGMAASWSEISKLVRSRLIVNATTQVSRTHSTSLSPDHRLPQTTRATISELSRQLADIRLSKSGRKDYDLTVIAYFNDMLRALMEIHRVLRPRCACRMVIGDSALYGIHVPTDAILMEIAEACGFRRTELRVLRHRGHRWVMPRRTYTQLRESEILLWKS